MGVGKDDKNQTWKQTLEEQARANGQTTLKDPTAQMDNNCKFHGLARRATAKARTGRNSAGGKGRGGAEGTGREGGEEREGGRVGEGRGEGRRGKGGG